MAKTLAPDDFHSKDPLKDATIVALTRVVDPLLDLMFDTGVTVHEFSQLVRDRAVRVAAKRVAREPGRGSKSRVAIVTGLPRSEVARILKSVDVSQKKRIGQHPARKVLAAWFDNPRFLAANGEPAVLPIFGKRRSFEQLVTLHSGGIPVRAMLDELTQIHAVEQLSDQRVKVKSRLPILTGLTSRAVAVIGERARDLLDTLTSNLRRTSTPLFEGTALLGDADLDLVPLIRREISEQSESLINSANSIFSRSRAKQSRLVTETTKTIRLGVSVYYFQNETKEVDEVRMESKIPHRKNLRRKRRPENSDRKPSATRRPASKGRL